MEQSPVIFSYTWHEAVADGQLMRLWADDVDCPAGKPVLATVGVAQDLVLDELRQLFEAYLTWHGHVEPTLPVADRLFATVASNGEKVWVIDDGTVITLLYPHEY